MEQKTEQKQSCNTYQPNYSLFDYNFSIDQHKKLLKCNNNNEAYSVCVSQNCQKSGLMCFISSCQCRQPHYNCHHIVLDRIIQNIHKSKQHLPKQIKQSYQAIYEIINNMIEQLSQLKEKYQTEEQYYGLKNQQLQFIRLINDHKISLITGKLISKLQKTFQKTCHYQIGSKEFIIKDFQSKKLEFNALCKYIQKYNSAIVRRQDGFFKFSTQFFLMDSTIVKNQDDKLTITKWLTQRNIIGKQQQKPLQHNFISLSSKLLFRASEHQFRASAFHQYCDGYQNTLVIVRTQFQKTIGGFSPSKWSSDPSGIYTADPSEQAFLFSLNLKEKYICLQPDKSIRCYSAWGPCFGSGRDLAICDNAGHSKDSYTQFPKSYNYKITNSLYKYQNNKESKLAFVGCPNGNSFGVREYQVYQIQKKNEK